MLRYLRAHGAGDAAEDLLQELWLKIGRNASGPIAEPRNYPVPRRDQSDDRSPTFGGAGAAPHRAVDRRMPGSAANDPGPDRNIDGRRKLALVEAELAKLLRAPSPFRQHRIDGRTQREIAAPWALSASTIESDLRMVYRLLAELREKLDEE